MVLAQVPVNPHCQCATVLVPQPAAEWWECSPAPDSMQVVAKKKWRKSWWVNCGIPNLRQVVCRHFLASLIWLMASADGTSPFPFSLFKSFLGGRPSWG